MIDLSSIRDKSMQVPPATLTSEYTPARHRSPLGLVHSINNVTTVLCGDLNLRVSWRYHGVASCRAFAGALTRRIGLILEQSVPVLRLIV